VNMSIIEEIGASRYGIGMVAARRRERSAVGAHPVSAPTNT